MPLLSNKYIKKYGKYPSDVPKTHIHITVKLPIKVSFNNL